MSPGQRRCGDFRTRYDQEMTWFPSPRSAAACAIGLGLLLLAPLVLKNYGLALLIQIGYLGIAALGLTLGAVNAAAAFAQPFALAASVALLGMIVALVLLPAKSLQHSAQA